MPSRTTDIKADELLATSAAGGNPAPPNRVISFAASRTDSGLPAHQKSLAADLEHDQAPLDNMLANPFEHPDVLDVKEAELSALTRPRFCRFADCPRSR